MKKCTVDAAGLFLLCALRNKPIIAKNLSVHTWTIECDQALEAWLAAYRKEHNGESPKEIIRQGQHDELRTTMGMMGIKERTFQVKENDFGFGLVDTGYDMTWYQPKPGNFYNSWDYCNLFLINDDLNEIERFLLKNYFDKSSKF